jgi:transketolase
MPSRQECVNAIRALAMDAVEKADSGHPGMPMGMADIAEVLWRHFLRFNPSNPKWPNRDRFIVSNGHGAMLLYSLLHLTGFNLSIEDLKQFRQWHSRTPGHPEYGHAPGVETTTGPLGQGLANAVGMAIAEQMLAAQFNRGEFNIVDHYTYVFAGDGDLMEGVSHEACSLAGTLGLGKLIVFYDDNGISIDGDVRGWFTDDTPKRFAAYHWHVVADVDGHDANAIQKAIEESQRVTDKPSLICCKTVIGFGAPKLAGDAAAHGAPLGKEEVAGARKKLNWPYEPFVIPDEIYAAWDSREKGGDAELLWNHLFAKYETKYPELAAEFLRRQQGFLREAWADQAQQFIEKLQAAGEDNATRKLSLKCLNAYAAQLPELVGGSADLTGSNCTLWSGAQIFTSENRGGNYIEYGVREFGMSAIINGMALHGGFIPFGGTFLTFSDYARNAVRLSALMQSHSIFVYSHDSIGLGEDGPTHQPIEQLPSLRIIPGLRVWRPCDGPETAVAWQQAIMHQGPSCLLLTRQNVRHQKRDRDALENIAKGGYILWEPSKTPVAILISTGSEIGITVAAAEKLQAENIFVRVVSMPCCEIFKAQDKKYQATVLPPAIKKRVAIEAAASNYWYEYVGSEGRVIGIDQFGASAPAKIVFEKFGFTTEHIVQVVHEIL